MLIEQLAVVSEVKGISISMLSKVSAALQKQVMRDFAPIWGVRATVDPFNDLEDVPIGYWPIVVMEDIGYEGAAGIHLDKDGQPFALVQYANGWELTTSHEVLEMLADPFGDRLVAGNSVMEGQGRVEYLVEVCDPSEAWQFGYTVNGITLSDFYTPNFFDPVGAPGVRYSYTGAITGPRQVLKDGYLSWHDPVTDHWWQLIYFESEPQFRDLGVFDSISESIRSEIDRRTVRSETLKGYDEKDERILSARSYHSKVSESTVSKARAWRAQIDEIRAKARG